MTVKVNDSRCPEELRKLHADALNPLLETICAVVTHVGHESTRHAPQSILPFITRGKPDFIRLYALVQHGGITVELSGYHLADKYPHRRNDLTCTVSSAHCAETLVYHFEPAFRTSKVRLTPGRKHAFAHH